MSLVVALRSAIAVEHEVVYGYGVAGARLRGHARRQAQAALVAHQLRRDRLAALLSQQRVVPPIAAVAYALPFAVTDATTAQRLCAQLEDSCTGAAWDLVAASAAGTDARSLGVDWLTDAAIGAAYWRGAAPVVALPGAAS